MHRQSKRLLGGKRGDGMSETTQKNAVKGEKSPWKPYEAALWLNEELGTSNVSAYRCVSGHREPEMSRSHGYYVMAFCRSGEVPYLAGDTVCAMQSKDLIVIPPQFAHSFLDPAPGRQFWEMDVIQFNQQFASSFLTRTMDEQFRAIRAPWVLHPSRKDQIRMEERFSICVEECQKRLKNWERIVQVMTTYILCMLSREMENRGVPLRQEPTPLMLQIMNYVEENLGDIIRLEDTALRFNISRSALSEGFRRKTGVGFYSYVVQRRLIEAKKLINEGLSMEQVAKQVGFGEYSAFYRAFKQKYGFSPREYRSQIAAPGVAENG